MQREQRRRQPQAKRGLHWLRELLFQHAGGWSIYEVALLFNRKIKMLKARKGERYASALTNMNLSNKVYKKFGSIKLKDYIDDFLRKSLLKK